MIGDKLNIEPHHTERAAELCEFLVGRLKDRFTISIAGQSGSGKSEMASEVFRLLAERGIKAGILQQDDYFVFPPKTNYEMRRRNLEQVSLYEVKLDFLDSNLRSFKRGESPIYKPLVIFDQDRITTEEMDTSSLAVLLVEGTYTSVLRYVDFRIYIDRDLAQTQEAVRCRAREPLEPFMIDVLKREHRIISPHKELADVLIPPDFGALQWVARKANNLTKEEGRIK